ncbi:hypothetical protein ABBQ38_004363 [Trebouxia sp. C0009 RCD-2024]
MAYVTFLLCAYKQRLSRLHRGWSCATHPCYRCVDSPAAVCVPRSHAFVATCDEFVQDVVDLGNVTGTSQPGSRAANASLEAAVANANIHISMGCCEAFKLFQNGSCRCDNAGEDLVLDMLDISHAQNQEATIAASYLCESILGEPIRDPDFNKTCVIDGQPISGR